MDLEEKTVENVELMIETIKTKLRMASGAALTARQFDLELYDDLRDIYDLVAGKSKFSVSEMDAIVMELGRLRKT